jgi:hypothetical protein
MQTLQSKWKALYKKNPTIVEPAEYSDRLQRFVSKVLCTNPQLERNARIGALQRVEETKLRAVAKRQRRRLRRQMRAAALSVDKS